jgi:sugar lactone lactonase YvrE
LTLQLQYSSSGKDIALTTMRRDRETRASTLIPQRSIAMGASNRIRTLTAVISLVAAACSKDSGDGGAAADSADRRDSAAASARGTTADSARRVSAITGLSTPESVKYDGDEDAYFITNINGNPSAKDGNGFIVRARPDSGAGLFRVDTVVRGGRGGATLHAPKGMAIVADTLWVADIDAVRGFNKRTGAPTRTVNFASMGALFLNDIATDAGNGVYITDTGIRFNPDGSMGAPGRQRIFRFKAGDQPSIALQGDSLGNPNGIAWDSRRGAFIVAQFGAPSITTWSSGDSTLKTLASGPGQFDGVEILADGRTLVSSWTDSSVYVVENDRMRKVIGGVEAPADIGYDTKRNLVLVPLFNRNSVELWSLGSR